MFGPIDTGDDVGRNLPDLGSDVLVVWGLSTDAIALLGIVQWHSPNVTIAYRVAMVLQVQGPRQAFFTLADPTGGRRQDDLVVNEHTIVNDRHRGRLDPIPLFVEFRT